MASVPCRTTAGHGWLRRRAALLVAVSLPFLIAAAPPAIPKPIRTIDIRRGSERTALSPNGRMLAILNQWSDDQPLTVEVRDVKSDKPIIPKMAWGKRTIHRSGFLSFANNGKLLIALAWGWVDAPEQAQAEVKVIDVRTKRVRTTFTLPAGRGIMQGVVTPDGKTLIVCGIHEAAALHDLTTGKQIAVLKGDERMPGLPCLKLNPTDKERAESIKSRENETSRLAISPDGKYLAVGTRGGWVSVWDIDRRRRLWRQRTYDGEDGSNMGLAFSTDSEQMVGVSRDRIIIWNSKSGKRRVERTTTFGYPHPFNMGRLHSHRVFFLPDGKLLLVGCMTLTGFIAFDHVENSFPGESWKSCRFFLGVEPDYSGLMKDVRDVVLSDDRSTLLFRFGYKLYLWDLRRIWPRK